MCGMVLPSWEMPSTASGIVPDIIINPHAIPSRMTVNQLLEVILGKTACLGGYLGDATPFQNNDINEFTKALESYNYQKNGEEVMYSGITGDQIKTSIFIGPTYYQRLKIMVADKIHSRGTGPLQNLTRQPAAGRANQGGLRVGEMERDAIISHGISEFLKESVMERSDKFSVCVDNKTGLLANHPQQSNNSKVEIPYTMKLLIQELESMGIASRMITDVTAHNPEIMKFLHENVKHNSIQKNIFNDDADLIDEDETD